VREAHAKSQRFSFLKSSLKAARRRRAAFRLQSREFVPFGHELSALKLILRISGKIKGFRKIGENVVK